MLDRNPEEPGAAARRQAAMESGLQPFGIDIVRYFVFLYTLQESFQGFIRLVFRGRDQQLRIAREAVFCGLISRFCNDYVFSIPIIENAVSGPMLYSGRSGSRGS